MFAPHDERGDGFYRALVEPHGVHYRPWPTLFDFHHDPTWFRGVRGPVGSGKTSGMIWEIMRLAGDIHPCRDGVRRSRWLITRNTYPELKSTTIKSWESWFGPDNGWPRVIYDTPIRWHHRWRDGGDGSWIDLEILFVALERPDHTGKIKSMDLTGAWMNEASEQSKAILDIITSRIGRYPPRREMPPEYRAKDKKREWPSRSCIIADTNSMDDDHWWYDLAEVKKPKGYKFFNQPGGLDEKAENIPNLPGGRNYYTQMCAGKRQSWIDVFVRNKYGSTVDGRPVYPEFNSRFHVATAPIPIMRGRPIILGWDYGLTPACVVLQVSPRGQVRVLREYVTWGGTMGVRQFTETVVKPALSLEFGGMEIISWGDPGGDIRSQNDEITAMDIQRELGIETLPTWTNLITPRIDAVVLHLTRLCDGHAGFIVDPSCQKLIKGMNGAYQFRRLQLGGLYERYTDQPDKNPFSHVCEALQYPLLEMNRQMRTSNIGAPPPAAPVIIDREMGY